VTQLLTAAGDPSARARITRSLGFMIFDSYRLNGWDEHET
jgi:hypothetical protein